MSGCVFVQLWVCVLMWDCAHAFFFHPRQIFESIILLFDPLCEIVDIAFSVEVPIGVSLYTCTLHTFLLSPSGPIRASL